MALTVEQIADLVASTQKNLGELQWTDLTTDLQEHVAASRLIKKERVSFESGTSIQRNIMKQDSGAAKHTGLYGTDSYNVIDVMTSIDVPWRHTTTWYAFERREFKMNSGKRKIFDLIKTRRMASMISLVKLLESTFWSKPADSTDTITPYGLLYWVVKNAAEGFNGGNPSGFTAGAGGLSSGAVTRWKNYSGAYTNFTKDDCIRKLKTCARKIQFMPPIEGIPEYKRGATRYEIFTNLIGIQEVEIIGEQQNDNLGRDIDKMNGKILLNGTPMTWVPFLDADSTHPFYFVDWSVFTTFFLTGEYMLESSPEKVPFKHTTLKVDIDMTWNTLCDNRRKLGVLYQA